MNNILLRLCVPTLWYHFTSKNIRTLADVIHHTQKMAPGVEFFVDRHVGPKFTVFVWEFDGKQFPKKLNSEKFMNSRVKIPGK